MNNVGVQNSSLAKPRVPDGFAFDASEDGRPAISSAQAFVSAELLFSGNYNRAGVDLVISNETRSVTIPEYFKGEHRSTLMSPEGASLSGKVVEAMTARAQYAQADQIASAVPAVGNVAQVMGSAVVTRNGVSVELKQGDRLLKGDVVQTGTDTTIGISFVDGTALGLASNARIVLDEMTYDPNGSSNSSLLSLVQGTITLVAGHTAKFGNMRVETPVATMGIRGTAVLVEIAADDGPTRFSVLREPDGKTGAFHLYDKGTGELIRVVSHAGLVTLVSPLGAGQPVSAIDQLKTLSDFQNEKSLAQQVFQIFFPNYNPDGPWANRTGSSSTLANSSGVDAGQLAQSGVPALIALASAGSVIPIGATAQEVWIFPETPAAPTVTAIAVANVVDVQAAQGPAERNFAISDQVTITIDGQVIEESAGRYVPGTGTITGVESTAPTPQGVSLAGMVHIDPATGVVTYDPSQFAFLGVGESAIYTIGFASRSGASVVPETLTLTINGLNDRPTVEHPIPDQRIREGCRFEYVIAACAFADLDANDTLSYRATFANGESLPNWLTFDPVTLTFSGTPPKGEDCVLHIKVIASDEHNATAVDQFDLVIRDNHHHHHHHRFGGDEMNGVMMASHEHSSAAVDSSSDVSTGTGDVASDSDQRPINLSTEVRESDFANCSEKCSIDSARAGDESSASSRDVASSPSDEHRSYDVSWNTTHNNSNARANESVHRSVSTGFDSDTSAPIDLHTGWSRATMNYSSDSHSTHYSFVTSNHSSTSWSGGSGNQHRETVNSFQFQRDISGVDSFVFRSDFGRDTTSDARSAEVMQTGRSWSGDTFDIAALVQVTEGFDLFTMHGEQRATSLRQVSSMELQTHQNDFHLV